MSITVRRFVEADAAEVSALITKTLRITNSKDYSPEYIEKDVAQFTPEKVIERASWTHFYVFCDGDKIVGCGAIGPYWGKEDESSLFNIFVLPEYQGKGVGRKIIETLEADEYALRANRIEIPASITACAFYRKMGYGYKNGIDAVDGEQLYRLEKFRMNHKLFIIEGLPCSGKSTTSAYVAELLKQHGNVCYVDEGTGNHPADYEFHALAPAGMLSEKAQIVSLKDYSGEMFDRLFQYKIYDFLPWETEKPLMLDKWRQFVRDAQEDTVYVFNCVLLQNPMCETMMRFGFSEEESRQYIAQIAEIIAPLNPVVVYLKNEDIADSVRKAAAERPGWLDSVIDYHVHGAYGKSIGAEGFEGYIQCLTERQERELRILSTLLVESLILENPQRDWQTARQTVKEYIEEEKHAEIKTL